MSGPRPLLAIYLSAHGFGHCTRTSAFVERLLARVACDLDVTAPCPPELWPRSLWQYTRSWRNLACDAGVVQAHDLAVDRDATAGALKNWELKYPSRLEDETRRLAAAAAVLADVPPLALEAAHAAGVPGFALANFSWDWIYSGMGFERAAARAAQGYRQADALFELEPAAPMPAFIRKVTVGVLGRTPRVGRVEARHRLGVSNEERLVLIAFKDATLCTLPAQAPGVRYVYPTDARVAGHGRRADVVSGTHGSTFVDLLAAADAVVGKAGYGLIADASMSATPLLYALREGFPEDAVLARWLEERQGTCRVELSRLASGEWLGALEHLLNRSVGLRASAAQGLDRAIDLLAAALTGR